MEHQHYTHSPQFRRILKEWDSAIGKETYFTIENYRANPTCFPLYNITYPNGIRETDTVLDFQIRCSHCKTIHTCHVPDQSNEVEYLNHYFTTCTECKEVFHLLSNFLRESKSNLHQQQQQPPKSSAYTCVPSPDIHDIRQRLKKIRAEIAKLENIRKKLNMNDPQVYEAECWFKRNRKDKLDELKTQEKRLEKQLQQYKTENFNGLKEVVISLIALAFLTLIFISLLYTAHLFTKECDDTTKAIVNAGVIFGLPLLYIIVRAIYKKRAGIIKHLHSRMPPPPNAE